MTCKCCNDLKLNGNLLVLQSDNWKSLVLNQFINKIQKTKIYSLNDQSIKILIFKSQLYLQQLNPR